MTMKDYENELLEKLKNEHPSICGIRACRNGKVMYETYLNETSADEKFHVYSVTKSILSLLYGIALDRGEIKSLDERIISYFPEYTETRRDDILDRVTIRDMLKMIVPYAHNEDIYEEYFSSDDWTKFSLGLVGGGNIGDFRYAGIIGPDILSAILQKATGMSTLDYANQFVFEPLGMDTKKAIIFGSKEEQLAYYNKRNINGWVADPKGVHSGGWGLSLSIHEMIKLAELYRNGGLYNNKRIVSKGWIQESTKKQSYCEQWGLTYGFLWWIVDAEKHIYAAMGDGGNTIYINESKGVSIGITGLFIPNAKDCIDLIHNNIMPLIVD